jgi:hypothetical protein
VESVESFDMSHKGTKTPRGHQLESHSLDTVLYKDRIEVNEESEPAAAKLQVCKHLSVVEGIVPFRGFQFDQKSFFNNNICSKGRIDNGSFVTDGDSYLPFEHQVARRQFLTKAGFVDRLQETGTKRGVHLKSRIDSQRRQFITPILEVASWGLCVLVAHVDTPSAEFVRS